METKGGDQVINTSNTMTTDLEPDDPLFQEIIQAQGQCQLVQLKWWGSSSHETGMRLRCTSTWVCEESLISERCRTRLKKIVEIWLRDC